MCVRLRRSCLSSLYQLIYRSVSRAVHSTDRQEPSVALGSMSGKPEGSDGARGQDTGDVRAPLPLDRLVPYLEENVEGFSGPLEVKQFKVRLLCLWDLH